MLKNAVKCDELPQYSKRNKTYFGQFINCSLQTNQISSADEFKNFEVRY